MKAFNESDSKGRLKKVDPESAYKLNPFIADKIKILNSKTLRLLQTKTQVFHNPNNKHIRTRLSHTNEVVANSAIISELLGINTNLCESIAWGHDIGHFPYGHNAERVLSSVLKAETGIESLKTHHSLLSVIIAELIERKGAGLNLCYETLEGIINHSRDKGVLFSDDNIKPEYSTVMYADKISYTFSDINDSIREGRLTDKNKIINYCANKLGFNQRERTMRCINSLCNESKDYVRFDQVTNPELLSQLKKSNKLADFKRAKLTDFMLFDLIITKMYNDVYYQINWYEAENKIKKVYELFNQSTINDYETVFKKTRVKPLIIESTPDPCLMISLMTDYDIDRLINKELTLNLVIRSTGLNDTAHHLMRKETSKESMIRLYSAWGKQPNKSFLFEQLIYPQLKKNQL
ncbi:MAG: HD domain-containing protein [Candidatus Nanoarchaeia archaeon]